MTVELNEMGDQTEVVLTHELLPTQEIRQMHSTGWDGCLTNLAAYLG